ncbi:MAG: DUF885 family protein [Acidobacteriota bacterium]|nr:DUF885 family protein [Acidobacteriota bacterium]
MAAALVLAACTPCGLAATQTVSDPLASAVQSAPQATPQTVEERSRMLAALLHEIWEDQLKHNPEYASQLGDTRYNDQLSDYSVAAVNASLARGAEFIQRLSEIDPTGLSRQEQISRDLMLRSLIDDQEGARFKEWQMPVTQYAGLQVDLPLLVRQLSFHSAKDFDDYIARLKKIPTAFSQVRENMELGMDEGRVPPAYLMDKVIAQAQSVADAKASETPFAEPLQHLPASLTADERTRIHDAVLDAIANSVQPAFRHFATFVKVQYQPRCRKDPGIWAIPDGDAYYAFRIRQSTTTNRSADEIHQIGLDEVKRDEVEMLTLVHRLGFADLASFRAAMATNPRLHATSSQQLIALYQGYEDQMRLKLPQLFGHLPRAPLQVVEMPAALGSSQPPAFYEEGTTDGSRPGRVSVNTVDFEKRLLDNAEAVAYHEGLPGHHLQFATEQELQGLPEFRTHAYYTAYTEGWGLYSERLGKEVGFYTDPYSDFGRLDADMWRAVRLVVDTGVHSKRWTRQQMVDYFHAHTALDESTVQSEVDRYIAWPAQALGYKLGQLKLLELRQRAATALGAKFDLRAFHDVVLDSGALPLDVLEEQVNQWIAQQNSATH